MQAVHTMADDILDHANMRRNQPAWHVKIGLFAVNDILLIETCIYKLIQKYFKSKECYGDIMNTFLKVSNKFVYLYVNRKSSKKQLYLIYIINFLY